MSFNFDSHYDKITEKHMEQESKISEMACDMKRLSEERDKYKKALEEINKKCNRSEPVTYTEFDRLFDEIDMITKEVLTK